jgi:hypothetical protein
MMNSPTEPSYTSYEERIYETAARRGWTAVRDGDLIEVSDSESVVRHRLGGLAEAEHDHPYRRALGRWFSACGYPDVVARLRGVEFGGDGRPGRD